MGADRRAFFEHAEVDVRLQLLESNRARETGGPSAHDHHVVLHHVSFGHFYRAQRSGSYLGCMRIAPSMRIVSPLIIGISKMEATSCANSSGLPRRGGKGTCLPREA